MKKTILIGLTVLTVGVLLWFLWGKGQLAIARQLDVDEFAYLHWAYHFSIGKLPYRDFFFYVPPGFLVALAPVFWFAHGVGPILAGRAMELFFFVLLCGAMSYLFWQLRRSWIALAVPVLLLFLPLPSDKFLEIRPDTLAVLLATIALMFQIRWMRGRRAWDGGLSGFFYSVSLLVLPKTVPNVLVAALITLFSLKGERRWGRKLKPLLVGFGIPLLIFGLWIVLFNDPGKALYSLIILPFEVNKVGRLFVMMPDLFFYPNTTFYGEPGYSVGLLTNHVLWIVGLGIGLYRLLTPALHRGKAAMWEELLVAGTFLTQVFFYVQLIPLKHAQYLIPIAPFVAWYTADGINSLWQLMRKKTVTMVIFAGLCMFSLGWLISVFQRVQTPKFALNNREALEALERIFATIPQREYVFDLDGRILYYPDPYYVCCLPFGQFEPFLSQPLPSLSQSLEQQQVRFVYEGPLQRVNTLPSADSAYIHAKYVPHPTIPYLWVRRDIRD